jgi:hypothetical protein
LRRSRQGGHAKNDYGNECGKKFFHRVASVPRLFGNECAKRAEFTGAPGIWTFTKSFLQRVQAQQTSATGANDDYVCEAGVLG